MSVIESPIVIIKCKQKQRKTENIRSEFSIGRNLGYKQDANSTHTQREPSLEKKRTVALLRSYYGNVKIK